MQYRANGNAGTATAYNINAPATPTAQFVISLARKMIGVYVCNSSTSLRYLKVFGTSSVTVGTTSAILDIAIPPNNNSIFINFEGGIGIPSATFLAVTGGRGLTDNTPITGNEVTGFIALV